MLSGAESALAFADLLRTSPVIPVVTLIDPLTAQPLAAAISRGGLRFLEITLRSEAAMESIELARDSDLIVGAGTVTTLLDAQAVIAAGAQFVVCPGLDRDIVQYCMEVQIPVVPGIATATELMGARAAGATIAKVFPVSHLGGPAFIRTLSAVWPNQLFMPTGGVSPSNAAEYLAIPNVVAIGGSWVAPAEVVAAGDWNTIREIATSASKIKGGTL